MKRAILAMSLGLVMAGVAMASVGDSWILPVGDRQGGGWTELAGAGLDGTSAWQGSGMDGTRRIFWSTNDAVGMPTTTELYTIQFYAPTQGAGGWQPIESQFGGSAGEVYPVDSRIPWAGMWGTNHQYMGTEFSTGGAWKAAGPGSHTPETADFNAGANGIYMWLTKGSSLYAKWDFGWDITRAWSAVKITQVTPEPSSLLLLALGGLFLRRKSR
jgi:hypothetical protein